MENNDPFLDEVEQTWRDGLEADEADYDEEDSSDLLEIIRTQDPDRYARIEAEGQATLDKLFPSQG